MPVTRAKKKSQKEEKESEERSGRRYPGCRRYCVWPRHCRLTECDVLWRPIVRFSIKRWLPVSTFPRSGGFGVTTVQGVQRREFALYPGYTKLDIFEKLKHRALEWTSKNLSGPTNNELIFLESSTFSSVAFPKISSSLEHQKELSVPSQLRLIPKLHNQGFTCRVFYQIMKSPLLFRLCPVCAGRCYTVIHPGTLRDTLFGFWIMQQLYCHMKKYCAKFHSNIFTNYQVMPTEVNRCRERCSQIDDCDRKWTPSQVFQSPSLSICESYERSPTFFFSAEVGSRGLWPFDQAVVIDNWAFLLSGQLRRETNAL